MRLGPTRVLRQMDYSPSEAQASISKLTRIPRVGYGIKRELRVARDCYRYSKLLILGPAGEAYRLSW